MTEDRSKLVDETEVANDTYEAPEITDFGSLEDLTRSGSSPLSDQWGGTAGGGS